MRFTTPVNGASAAAAVVLLAACASRVLALDPARPLAEHSIDVWGTQEGLPQNSVLAVLQTRDGYLWLATHEGLVRFDGMRFKVYDTSNSPTPRTYIESLHESADGALWFGSYNGGVTRLHHGRFRTYTTGDGMSANAANDIAEEKDGTLWFATPDSGINRFRGGRFEAIRKAQGLPDDHVQALLRARDGSVWIGTEAGLARHRDGRFQSFGTAHGLPSGSVTAIAEDREGTLWIGTTRGLARLQGERLTVPSANESLPSTSINSLLADGSGSLWIGTNRGIARLRDGRLEALTAREGLSQDVVRAFATDREGSLWIGTDGGGLNRLRDAKVATVTSRDPQWHASANALLGDGAGGLWIGAYGGQLARLRDGAITLVPTRGVLGTGPVRSLARDESGGLWIGTDEGLFQYDGKRLRALSGSDGLAPAAVRAILCDRTGAVWVGTDGEGVARREGGRFVHYRQADGLPGNRVRLLHEDRQGRIWVGTYGGLSLVQDGRFTNYGPSQGLHLLARSLHEDADGTFWLGTFGDGLFRFRDGRLAGVTSRQGLFSDTIYGITEDASQSLWMSSNKGIFQLGKRELDDVIDGRRARVTGRSFGVDDGMKSAECNGGSPAVSKMADGSIWFPTLAGLARADPAHIPRNEVPPLIVIESLAVDGRAVETTGPILLPPDAHRIEVHYAGLSFVSPERVRMSYKLEGFDADWVEAGVRRTAEYTNLPPGAYTFRVAARNEDGVSSASTAALGLEQQPHFYERRGFLVACGLGVVLMGLAAYRLRIAHLRRAERALQARVVAALAEVKVLSGLLPVCASCKKIRDDKGYWSQIEVYISEHSEADFSHGICPDCMKKLYPEYADRVAERRRGADRAPSV
jgi:ligand-binding sensor domain-containing protein